MPVYDVVAAAEALGVPTKQVDNILSRNRLPGVEHKRRGVTRRIAPDAVVALRVALEIGDALGLPVPAALGVAHRIIESGGTMRLSPFAHVTVDLDALRASTIERLDNAVETVGRRARGRPSRRAPSRGTDQLL
jgi:hypothetical protein